MRTLQGSVLRDVPKLEKRFSEIASGRFQLFRAAVFDDVSAVHAGLDLTVFGHIAQALGIGTRYVGEEPFSPITGLYNQVMLRELPAQGVACRVLPRLEINGQAVSASAVRQAVHDGAFDRLRPWVPEATWRYLTGPEGQQAVTTIQASEHVIHH